MFGRLDVIVISYIDMYHVDDEGIDFHGINDPCNEPHAYLAPNLSTKCKAYIEGLLRMDVSVDAVMDRHLSDPYFMSM